MSNKVKNIDLLDRNSLIILAKKLNIAGHTNKYNNPYRNKDYLKSAILSEIKQLKKKNRTKSLSNKGVSKQSGINNNNNNNIGNLKKNMTGGSIPRSKSMSSMSNLSSNSSNNNNFQNITNSYESCIFPPQKKLVAIGDIHGDLSVAIKCLKLANVIDRNIPNNTLDIQKINWSGGNTFVIQLGDQIDRVRPSKLYNSLCIEEDEELYQDEGSDLKIIYLFEKLNIQAQKYGGAVISVLGNHELMNVDGDFRYVSPKEFAEFGNYFNGKMEYESDYPYGYKERKDAFTPGGIIAKKLAKTRYSVVQVGKWIFVHGGITSECAKNYSLQNVNKYIQRWLEGDTSIENMRHVQNLYHRDDDEHSPFWSRTYSDIDEWGQDALIEFKNTFNLINVWNSKNSDYKAEGIVMGHSPQFMYGKGINSSLNNRIWRVDVGASRAFGEVCGDDKKHRCAQILIIHNDGNNNDTDFQILREA